MASFANGDEDDAPPGMSQFVDELTDKGKAARSNGLAGVLNLLRRNDVQESQTSLNPLFETLLLNLKGILRKANGDEFALACSVVGALGMCLDDGPDASTAVTELLPVLLPLASAESTQPERAEQALFALGALAFLCNEEPERLAQVVAVCEANISGFVADEPKTAALKSWGLLLPLMDAEQIHSRAAAMVSLHAPLLTHASLDVRVESAENLVMLKELAGEEDTDEANVPAPTSVSEQGIVVEDPHAFVTAKDSSSAKPKQGLEASDATEAQGSNQGEDEDQDEWLDQLISNFMELSADDGAAKSKRDAKEQRSRLKDIVAYVQEEELPNERLTLDKLNVPLDTWMDIKRVAFAKEVLRDGFNSHVTANPLLQQILGLGEKDLGGHLFEGRIIGTDERSYYTRDNGKAAALARNKARRKRDAVKEQFFSAH